MRFVAVKTEEQQARGMLFHTRDLLVRHRTQSINALRGHLAEFGVVAPQGLAHVGRLASAIEDPGSGLSASVRELGSLLLGRIACQWRSKILTCSFRLLSSHSAENSREGVDSLEESNCRP